MAIAAAPAPEIGRIVDALVYSFCTAQRALEDANLVMCAEALELSRRARPMLSQAPSFDEDSNDGLWVLRSPYPYVLSELSVELEMPNLSGSERVLVVLQDAKSCTVTTGRGAAAETWCFRIGEGGTVEWDQDE